MKALLVSPEFPLSFWSFPKSCRLRGSKTGLPPLGLITVAALLPDDWELRLADLNTRSLDQEDLEWADIVLISAMYIQRKGLAEITLEAKRKGKTVVVGGPYPTALPEESVEAGADYVVRGEGESAVPLFLDAMKRGETGVVENLEKPDMSISPIPRFDLLNFNDYNSLTIQTSRGCPFNCEFCDVINLFGRKPRYKHPGQVIAELEALDGLGAKGDVFICDDNFIGNKRHARALIAELTPWSKSRGEPFTFMTQVSINLGQDLEMIDLMTEANLGEVFIGIESPDENVLQVSRKYQNIKNPLVESVENIKKNGMTVMGSFIIGLDGEEKGAGERIAAFVERTDMPAAMLGVLQAPPNTALWDRLEGEGRLRGDVGDDGGTFSALNYDPLRPEQDIMEEYAAAWDYLYEPSRYLKRAYRYYLAMRPTRKALAISRGETPPDEVPDRRRTLRRRLVELRAFFKLLWWQGIRASYRGIFWRQLIGIRRRNPTRFRRYMAACAMGEDFFDMRRKVRGNVDRILKERELDSGSPEASARRAAGKGN
jgi:radical SAM superfamily enzyme YgiQ (UPF0313 family)